MSAPVVVMAKILTDDSPSICIQDYYQHHHKTAGSSDEITKRQRQRAASPGLEAILSNAVC